MPNEVTFPFESLNVKLKDGSSFNLKGSQLATALQYIPSRGYPPLVETLKNFTYQIHQPPNWEDKDVIVTNGSQDGISKSIEMCIQEGDPILVQNPLYSGTEVVVSYVVQCHRADKQCVFIKQPSGFNETIIRSLLHDNNSGRRFVDATP